MPIIMVSETAGCWTKLVTNRTSVATGGEVLGFKVLKSPLLGLGSEITGVATPSSCFKFAQVALNGLLET